MANSNPARIVRVVLEDFAGKTGVVDLGSLSLLTGMNEAGKTTLLNALSIATTGRPLGWRRAVVDSATWDEYSGSSGRWAIETTDAGGCRVRRWWSGGQFHTSSTLATTRISDDHEAAVRTRYGDLGLTVDVGALLAMGADALRTFVLDLCARNRADNDSWTRDMVLADLAGRIPGLTLPTLPDEVVEPLAVVDALEAWVAESLTDTRRSIRTANIARNAPAVPGPDAATHDAARTTLAEAEADLADANRRWGAVVEAAKARGDARKSRIDAAAKADATAAARYDSKARSATEAREKVAGHERELAALPSGAAAPTPDTTTAAGMRLDALRAAAPARPAGYDTLADLEARVHAADVALATDTERAKSAEREAGAARDRAQQLGAGTCPTCGQATAAICDSLAAEATRTMQSLQAARSALATSASAAEKLRAEHTVLVAACRKYDAAAKKHVDEVRGAEQAFETARRNDEAAAARRSARMAERDAEARVIQARLDAARAELEQAVADAKSAETEAVAARQARVSAEAEPVDSGDATESQSIAATVESATSRVEAARVTIADLDEKARVSKETEQARAAAESEHARLQEQRRRLESASDAIEPLRALVAGAYVAPLTSRINEFMGGFLGTFEARFSPRFTLGFRREGGVWVPMHRLSTGAFAIAAIAIAWALCELRHPPLRLLCLDNINDADAANLDALWGAVQGCVDDGSFDQVVVAGRSGPDMTAPEGVVVVNMNAATAGTVPVAASKDGAAVAA